MSQSIALVFPGQGSQSLGMLADLAEKHAVIKDTFAQASDALGQDLWSMAQQGPESVLNSTENTQPILLTSSVALWRLWQQQGGQTPSVIAGHSLGEYSALVCAGAISLVDGVRLVRLRGELMQAAVPSGAGAMAAILGLDDQSVVSACESVANGDVVSAVNFNCPGQVVIAGEKQAVARGIEACKIAGAKRAIELPVSVPSHCALMRPAAEKLAQALSDVEMSLPTIKVVHNVTAAMSSDLDELKALLVQQLYSPVRWTESVQAMQAMGVSGTVECGPGKVLSGLNKKVDRALNVSHLGDIAGFTKALELQQNEG